MTAEQDGLDPAKVQAEHQETMHEDSTGYRWCFHAICGRSTTWPCLPYRLAALALDLQGKVARVEALFAGGPDTPCRTVWHEEPGLWGGRVECVEVPMEDLRTALADPTPAAPSVTT